MKMKNNNELEMGLKIELKNTFEPICILFEY